MWASEPTLAANSLLHFLGVEHGLKLSEWQHFYRLLDESALTQIFRVTSGLDSLVLGEPQIVSQVKAAWEQARTVGAAGRFLNAVLEKALSVSKQVRDETAMASWRSRFRRQRSTWPGISSDLWRAEEYCCWGRGR